MDKGPGIANLAQAMSDGYSTAGTMGGGMGAMKRIASDAGNLHADADGTIVLVQVGKTRRQRDICRSPGWPCLIRANASAAMPGHATATPERTVSLLVDGLGHGREAAEAAQEAVATFRKRAQSHPGEILTYVHDALKKTRGAVAAVAEIRPREGTLIYAGVGNISAVVLSEGTIAQPGFAQRHAGGCDLTRSRSSNRSGRRTACW